MRYTYFSHLVFDNSLTRESSYHSRTHAVAPSELKSQAGKLPITSTHWISPPNALELSWTSNGGGDWSADIDIEEWRVRDMRLDGDHLCMWVYAMDEIVGSALPVIGISEPGKWGRSLRLNHLIDSIPANEWMYLKIPFSAFGSSTDAFDYRTLRRISFYQSIDDGIPHTVYIDEIKVCNLDTPNGAPVQPPTGFAANGSISHIDLKWDAVTDPNVEYIVIHRSSDGTNFEPIGIQNPAFNRYTDFVDQDGTFAYRLTAVNHDYQASAPSPTVSAKRQISDQDDDLLTMIQEAHFRYYWEGAHPDAGLALECIPGDPNLVALGASGFGMMAWLVGVERGFITRQQAIERMHKALKFLETADRYHGVWSHFMDGRTGKTIPLFGKYDNGGDLVETAFMAQGLLAARQYFDQDTDDERQIRDTITRLWESIEWDWYQSPDFPGYLIWHWSAEHGFHINHPLIGWNETLIVYLLAIASPTHPVSPDFYHTGWASQSEQAREYREGWGKTTAGNRYTNSESYDGIKLDVGVGVGGPLFFTHYSFLGFDPRGKRDQYCNYFDNNRNITLINHRYCTRNPGGYKGYSSEFWGLTASDDHTGYNVHEANPKNDNGTITPTGALAGFPYTPAESMAALKTLYYRYGRDLFGIYGFRDAINLTENWISPIFMGLNQAPIVVMIENHRTGLLWDLFMRNSEIAPMLEKIGFVEDKS